MAREIVWTTNAQEDYRSVISYLLDEFGDAVAEKYTDRLFNILTSLQTMPFMGKSHPEMSAIHQMVVRPYTVICYLVLPEQIVIVNLMDSRKQRL